MEENDINPAQPKNSGLLLLLFFVVMAGVVIYLITTSNSSNTPQVATQNQNSENSQTSESDKAVTEDSSPNQNEAEGMTPENETSEDKADSKVKIVNVTGSNFQFSPKTITVNKGDTVRIVFSSENGFHAFVLDQFGVKTKTLNTGGTDIAEFVADQAGTFEYYCSVGSHRAMGMVGNLIVQ